ncbi:MAG: glycosyltransferase [Candidatus Shapirobacteria bacterium]
MKNPKVAIYYDWLNQWGGAERVLLDILEIYPQADIYTLYYDALKTNWLPKGHKIISLNLKNKLLFTPFYAYNLEQIDFSAYDLVISTTSNTGHCLMTPPKTLFICYFHNINRYLYQHPPTLLKPLLHLYKKVDQIYSKRPDYILCNSNNVANKIQIHYHRNAQIIYPGIDTKKFVPNHQAPQDYFLIVSRLVAHKRIDLVINSFINSPYHLKIVGTGRDEAYLKCLASDQKNIEFYQSVDDRQLINLYQNCLGLIYPQEEDFGLTALEVQSCGRGVIAYERGGATETVINEKTGIFFNTQSVESLSKAIEKYLQKVPNPTDCRHQANRFDRENFMLNFNQLVDSLWLKR